jgi:hypothetical protein
MAYALIRHADLCPEQSFGSEKGHLGVIGDSADPSVCWSKIENASLPELVHDIYIR